jgi:hypothetical protein
LNPSPTRRIFSSGTVKSSIRRLEQAVSRSGFLLSNAVIADSAVTAGNTSTIVRPGTCWKQMSEAIKLSHDYG